MQIVAQPVGQRGRRKPAAPKTDMTPMVDLGFLLITFFVLTAEMSTPRTVNLNMPKDSQVQMPVKNSDALTVLINGDKLMYYKGNLEEAIKQNRLQRVSLNVRDGLGGVIREFRSERKRAGSDMVMIVKPGPDCVYGTVVKILDETLINDVERYVMVSASKQELDLM